MSITVFCNAPKQLLHDIKQAIDDGSIVTWGYDKDGDFTHSVDQWDRQAWLRPVITADMLTFGLIGREGVTMGKVVYAVYHGRFIEMLLAHFDESFSLVSSTALGTQVDTFKSAS